MKHIETCLVCGATGSDLTFAFTDVHGEAACERCGTPYLLVGYAGRERTECSIRPEKMDRLREYWREKRRRNGLGGYFGEPPADVIANREAFLAWADAPPAPIGGGL